MRSIYVVDRCEVCISTWEKMVVKKVIIDYVIDRVTAISHMSAVTTDSKLNGKVAPPWRT